MKNILVVFTGGTIGSVAANGAINTADSAKNKLLSLFKQNYKYADQIHFDTLQPLQILSENLAPPAWKIMVEAINAASVERYDGIIVTHGTDTLAYTAAALGFIYNSLEKPLLLVSSDYPLDNPAANGLPNFICSVEFIRQRIANGVFVPYRNAGEGQLMHIGTRLTSSWQLTGDFYSVQNQPFARFDGSHFALNEMASTPSMPQSHSFPFLKPAFSDCILMIKPYPGLDYTHFEPSGVKAVLHDLYHSGTACASGQWGGQYSLVEFLKRCREQSVPVYLAPAHKTVNAYQSTHTLIQAGAKVIWNMSIEAAYVKLMLVYGNFAETQLIDDFLEQNIAGEKIDIG